MRIARGLILLSLSTLSWCQPIRTRRQAEEYLTLCARHYGVPVNFARAVVEQESGWHSCAVSSKGAVGLMQLMPATARRLGVRNRCDPRQNILGGIRYLAWLSQKFHGDLRLVAAAYYAGEKTIERQGLGYSNRDVVVYVSSIRRRTDRQRARPRTVRGSGRTR